jgi:pimeloyl-ACP methyl ester carboxylesterase
VADPHLLRLSDGRALAYDDVGDPASSVVVYLHGTPDSRLARHPDDELAGRAGIRLLAVDRPGFGRSDAHAASTLRSLGGDLAQLLDAVGAGDVGLLGWSAGGLAALGAAAALGDRVRAMTLVGTVPPVEAYADPLVLTALGPGRQSFAELAVEVPPGELAEEVAPYLVPFPLSADVALEHVLEGAGDVGRSELAAVPGAAEQMARALVEAVRSGVDGLRHDVARQLEPGLALDTITAPVRTVHGELDPVSPPEVGRWLAQRVRRLDVEVHPGAGHHLLFPRWLDLLEATVSVG